MVRRGMEPLSRLTRPFSVGWRPRGLGGPDAPWFDGGGKGPNLARQDVPEPTGARVLPDASVRVFLSADRILRMPPHGALALVGTLCNDATMAKTVIVKLTDDIDGSDADETVHFALDGRSYEIDVSTANAAKLRDALRPFVERARTSGGQTGGRAARPVRSASAETTLYSQLEDDEKARFRAWANMATARRISDARVQSWISAGRP